MPALDGKVALVTGASRGIGKATALQLAGMGCDVAVVSLEDVPDLEAVAGAIRRAGRRVLVLDVDVADHARTRRAVDEVVAALGPVDILVNNAGMSQPRAILEMTEADWDRTMAVNLKSVFNWSKAVLAGMLARGWGRIISISSLGAKNGGGGPPHSVSRAAYAASKAGILGFTRGLALEAAPAVTVNAICPGPIYTRLTESIMGGERGREYARRIPVGRLGTPEDVAAAVAFFASPDASFVTGEVMDVNGGIYLD